MSILFISCVKTVPDEQELNDFPVVESIANASSDTLAFEQLVESYEDPDRGVWQNPNLIIDQFGDLKGKTVADIGAGTGYFSFKLAANGADVIAIDIDEQFLDYIVERKQELVNLSGNIEVRLSVPDDPLLIENEVHFILIVNTYHFLNDREKYLPKLRSGLKEGGKIIIVDFKTGKLPVGPLEKDKINILTVKEELTAAGFSQIQEETSALKYQYMIIANR
ncbi:MAG: class I SAM-dependent methyltransferase [Bacteroidota bacterium]